MLTIHHLGISQSDRVVWLCEELGVSYELKRYARAPQGGGPPEYKALSPFGTAPVITDGDLVLGESGAIIEYIIHRHGNGRLSVAPQQPNYPDYLYWLHFANGSMMAACMIDFVFHMGKIPDDNPAARLRGRGDRAFKVVEDRLGKAPYFAGDAFTAADIIMLFPLTTMRLFVPRSIADLPNLRSYLARVTERPAFRRAMAKADPDLPIKID